MRLTGVWLLDCAIVLYYWGWRRRVAARDACGVVEAGTVVVLLVVEDEFI